VRILRRSRKALSPVVASIILIAVTVAVSIAVAAWMGALSFSFMNNGEQLTLGTPYGLANGGNTANITATNVGPNAWTVVQIRVNNTICPFTWAWTNGTAGAGVNAGPVPAQNSVTLILNAPFNFYTAYSYNFIVISAKNNEYQTTTTCP
jgi:flagellin-like protein